MIEALKKPLNKKVCCDPAESSDESHDTLDEDQCEHKCTPLQKTVKLEVNDSHETCFAFAHQPSKNKKQKVKHCTAETVGEVLDAFGNVVPTRALIDTRTSQTLGLAHAVSKLSPKAFKQSECTAWKAMSAHLKLNKKC